MTTLHLHSPPANFSASHALLGRLYLEHRDFLRRLLLGQFIHPRDVDDIVQDVFIAAWRNLSRLVTPEQARPWLVVIGLNHARNHRKLARHEREVFAGLAEDVPEQEDATSPETLLQATYGVFRLKRFLEKVGARVRAVMIPYLEGRSIQEIAESLGLKTKTVHGRLRLARERLEMGRRVTAKKGWPVMSAPRGSRASRAR
ncbi:RNA polymerase sigma factor [Polyangium jinanense]|uniref:RNA polymerase sigma factor n=1 Tax=Polyangium jinanense TaxID=2829994 RepID=A0A9X3XF64_9BACT|nr:sigma-70 family RNA polymerase sigma factor [Polyangium jinanense]MDC3961531.1 sigma-70 family RNA polymerase sigma factor [Polyangium jinanense]MDC3989022.1 sigma-70 family RNA polymerase sigma factor [Polyangium jinanense]